MSTDPDQIRDRIEYTRSNLSNDVDALAYKASPSRMVQERKDRARGAMRGLRDTVMGASSDAGDHAHAAAGKLSDTASAVSDSASAAPTKIKRAAEGNPVAAGVVVFGAAWLVSSLLPKTEREQQAAAQVKATAQEHADEVKGAATDAAHEMQENLRDPVQHAAQSVKATATDAARTVKDEGQSAARDVGGDVKQARDNVRSS
jgi:hypothetical protein